MAASTLPKPGTKLGPCEPRCEHTDCAQTRAMAAAVCRFCAEPIGYDRRFYDDSDTHPDAPKRYVHAVCLEDAVEAQRRPAQGTAAAQANAASAPPKRGLAVGDAVLVIRGKPATPSAPREHTYFDVVAFKPGRVVLRVPGVLAGYSKEATFSAKTGRQHGGEWTIGSAYLPHVRAACDAAAKGGA